jgi:iron complex outermembrane receptor protein
MDAEFRNRFKEYNLTATTWVNPGLNIPSTYKNTSFSELSWKYPAYGFSAAAEIVYFGDTYAYDDNRQTYHIDAYTISNLRASLEQKVSNWSVKEFLRVDNIFDKNYVSNVKVNTTTALEPGLDRNFTVGLSASYKF